MAYKIEHLSSGGLIPNYFCPARCGHCLYACGPRRSREYISEDRAEEIFRAVKRLGCGCMHIGGGEPMVEPEALGKVLSAAGRAGVSVEYVETNSAWFKERESAIETLLALKEQGLGCLLISISPFHNQSIPAESTKGVMDACFRAGIRAFPWVADLWPDLEAMGEGRPHSPEEYCANFGRDYWQKLYGRYWLHLGGRAAYFYAGLFGLRPLEDILESNPGPCPELWDTSHFHVDLYGNYVPGLCSGLAFPFELMGGELPPEGYPALTALAESGPAGLLKLARERGFAPAGAYLNKCHLCLEMRSHLVKSGWDHPDLAPAGFYRNLGVGRGPG